MENKEIFARYKALIFEGKDYEFIKRELERESLTKDESVQMLIELDEWIAHYQMALQERSKTIQQMILGGSLVLLGILIYSFSLSILKTQYLFAWGAILTGAWIFKEGYKAYKIPLEETAENINQDARRINRKL